MGSLRFQAPDGSYYLATEALEHTRARGVRLRVLREIHEEDIPVRFFLPHEGAVVDPPPKDARLAVLARLLSESRADGSVHIRFLGRNCSVPPDGFALDRSEGNRKYVWQVVPTEETHGLKPLDERFRSLRELCASDDTRLALSLGGGGLKLFAHAPALRLLETIGCAGSAEEVWGTSAGAMAGLLYAQGLSPHAIEQMGFDLYAGRVDLPLRPSKLFFMRRLLQDALSPVTGSSAAGFVDCARGLERMLEQYCASLEPRLPFFCTAFNLGECRAEVLSAHPVEPHLSDFITQTDPREAVLASSAVPLIFVPRVIRRATQEHHYVDGSMCEDVPLYSIVRKWDRDREAGIETRDRLAIIYVRLTGSLDAYRMHPRHIGKLRVLQTVAASGMAQMHARDLALISQREDVDLIGLELGDSTPGFFDTALIPEYIRSAKETFPEQLAAHEQRLRDAKEAETNR